MLVALFLPWYSADGTSLSAWQAMAVDDVILAVAAVLAVIAAFTVAFPRLGSLSVAATSLGVGAWLGLIAATTIVIGAWTGAGDEGPARRSPDSERRTAEEALAHAELLKLPPDTGGGGAEAARG